MRDVVVSVRIPEEIDKEIRRMAKQARVSKSAILREILELGLYEKKLRQAIKWYIRGRFSLDDAADYLGISIFEFIDIMKERHLLTDGEKFEEGLKARENPPEL